MKTSVVAAHISPHKYPPQAQFKHEIVPTQVKAMHQLNSQLKQGSLVDIQAMQGGNIHSAGSNSKRIVHNKHPTGHINSTTPIQSSKEVVNSNDCSDQVNNNYESTQICYSQG